MGRFEGESRCPIGQACEVVSDCPQVIEHHEIADGNPQHGGPNVAPDRSQLVGFCNRQVG